MDTERPGTPVPAIEVPEPMDTGTDRGTWGQFGGIWGHLRTFWGQRGSALSPFLGTVQVPF